MPWGTERGRLVPGTIFGIGRGSAEDGPGIRTVVFTKGCPLRCVWCHSPESQSRDPQLGLFASRCIGCGACIHKCPQSALALDEQGKCVVDWSRCGNCGQCARVCPSSALVTLGETKTAREVVEIVERDRRFYKTSGGGVTFSGGEPLAQPGFLEECLRGCRELGIRTAVETCGHADWQTIERLYPWIDLFLYDIKCIDHKRHQELTGVDNSTIVANLLKLDRANRPTTLRVPLIPGFNDQEDSLRDISDLAAMIDNLNNVELLPYNPATSSKYAAIGRPFQLENIQPYSPQQYTSITSMFELMMSERRGTRLRREKS
jgi:pyruvate formate lyase activating enzyme